ncbi:MAG: hypothetical protein L3J03_02780 [Desulfobacterales bacterium]|nr:hypothetical protein [Desulfobacterales bacterium]
MELKHVDNDAEPCCAGSSGEGSCGPRPLTGLPMASGPVEDDEPCCGPPPGPPSSPHERPGYQLCGFVRGFRDTPMGPVPLVRTRLNPADRLATIGARLNIGRNDYRVAPGLYGVGSPDPDSPVLVTANYKLSFDTLRRELDDVNAWILVLDTRGINVWCAAGKGTLSTAEVIARVKSVGLERIVRHRRLILPQLGATGIAAHKLKKGCGFEAVWGPVQARDIKKFLNNGLKADPAMRQVTFTLAERLLLVPVEISLVLKPSLWVLLAVLILSGIGHGLFSVAAVWQRGPIAAAAYLSGIVAGAVAVPALLPWLPGRAFYIKGLMTGLTGGALVVFFNWSGIRGLEAAALILLAMAASSYTAMNFTGATPYTSPTGVEKEMRQGIPVQILALFVAAAAWVGSRFIA